MDSPTCTPPPPREKERDMWWDNVGIHHMILPLDNTFMKSTRNRICRPPITVFCVAVFAICSWNNKLHICNITTVPKLFIIFWNEYHTYKLDFIHIVIKITVIHNVAHNIHYLQWTNDHSRIALIIPDNFDPHSTVGLISSIPQPEESNELDFFPPILCLSFF